MDAQHRKSPDNILVIKLGALGDFIQATGPMKAIRNHHKGARLTLLTTKPFVRIAEACGYFDDIIIDERPRFYEPKKWLSLKKQLNTGHFSRVYDLQNNDRTSLYLKLFSPKPEWVGAAKGASHRNISAQRTAGHAYDGHVQTLQLAGIHDVEIDTLDWANGKEDHKGLKKPYVLFAAGSAPGRTEKRWPAQKYGVLASRIHDLGYQPVLIGTIAEIDVNHIIKKACPQALDLTAKTSLFDLVALGRNAAAAIGNDTGPMHMIAPTTCPCTVLFSRHSNPNRHAPKGSNVNVIYREDLESLTPEDVLQAFSPRHDPAQTAKSSTSSH